MTRTSLRLVATALGPIVAIAALAGCTAAAEPPASIPPATAAPETDAASDLDGALAALETEYDARLGLAAIDTRTGEALEYRADERFAFASTYKALAAAAVLDRTTDTELDAVVPVEQGDLVTYSPITETRVGAGMTLRELADAAVRFSDNTAGNLLFDALGGPAGFDAALEEVGDDTTVASREETALNDWQPGSEDDTTTPLAFARALEAYAVGDALDDGDRQQLREWLVGNTTGDALIRAGAPEGWMVGDKTGSAAWGTRNDIAVVWPPDDEPYVLAVLSSRDDAGADAEYDDALIADAARVAIAELERVRGE